MLQHAAPVQAAHRGIAAILIVLLAALVLVAPPSVAAEADAPPPPGIQPRSALGLDLSLRTIGVPFVGATLYADDFAFAFEAAKARLSLFDLPAHTQVIMSLARYRLPVTWNDWRPAADIGLLTVRTHAGGVDITANGFTIGAGIERPLGATGAWALRGETRYVRILDQSHWMAGVGFEWRLPLPERSLGRGAAGTGVVAGGPEGTPLVATAVNASGRVTGVSLSMSASGYWEVSADLINRATSVYLNGVVDGESGSIGFSNATDVSFNGRTLSITFVESDTHEGKPVTATIHVSVSPTSFSLSIAARRSDGLSASASVSGTTTTFEVIPLREANEG